MTTSWKRTLLPAGLVVAVLGGAVAYTADTAGSADRTVPTRLWGKLPASSAQQKPGSAPVRTGPLGKLLLPVPDGFVEGPQPDPAQPATELNKKQAEARMRVDGAGLTGQARREYEKRIPEMGLLGLASRSFMSPNDAAVIDVALVRLADPARAGLLYEVRVDAMKRKPLTEKRLGPGLGNAVCYAGPSVKDPEPEDLHGVMCVAQRHGLLVLVTAVGAEDIGENTAVTEALRHQLELIASPGKNV
ncbi:hypothetical protein ABZ714_02040 [Streptomyces sp. NPDC006798]|uniref:hypothetical protein n=1 Tax=Streptomyces sp. NPDC006798 TaxID=3155462 RepID=UPI0033DC87D9